MGSFALSPSSWWLRLNEGKKRSVYRDFIFFLGLQGVNRLSIFVQYYLELAVNPHSEQLAKNQLELESVSNIVLRITHPTKYC